MRTAFAIFVGCITSYSVNANDGKIELLAGVEAGIDTSTAMSDHDLVRTQLVLSQEPVGMSHSWHNPNSGLQYLITINTHYHQNHRKCIDYSLSIIQGESKETKRLNACKNGKNQWISTYIEPKLN